MSHQLTIKGADRDDRGLRVLRDRRNAVEELLLCAAYLDPCDQALVHSVYDRGIRVAELARATRSRPAAVRRRLHRIAKRLRSPLFRYVMCNSCHWPLHRRRIAEAVILRGEPQREAAARLGVTLHQLRQEILRIHALYEAHTDRQR